MKTIGTKREVWERKAKKTVGGLRRSALMKNRRGQIVSIKKHLQGQRAMKYLIETGQAAELYTADDPPKKKGRSSRSRSKGRSRSSPLGGGAMHFE